MERGLDMTRLWPAATGRARPDAAAPDGTGKPLESLILTHS